MTDAPDLLPLNDNDDATAPGQRSPQRWLLGIGLTVVLNLAVTVAAFGGLWVQNSSLDLQQSQAVTEQLTTASEQISSDNFTAQAAGFRALERIAEISPKDQDHVLDLAEAYLSNGRPSAEVIDGYTGQTVYVANAGTQAAVDVIRARDEKNDQGGPGQRTFHLTGMVVEAARFHDVIMRGTQGQTCTARRSEWDRAVLTGSVFWECGFAGARFTDAELRDVRFEGANLEYADFTGADLTGADLDRAAIKGIVLKDADLTNATFSGTSLKYVDFAGVKSIAGADFSHARELEGAQNLRNAPGADSARWPWRP